MSLLEGIVSVAFYTNGQFHLLENMLARVAWELYFSCTNALCIEHKSNVSKRLLVIKLSSERRHTYFRKIKYKIKFTTYKRNIYFFLSTMIYIPKSKTDKYNFLEGMLSNCITTTTTATTTIKLLLLQYKEL